MKAMREPKSVGKIDHRDGEERGRQDEQRAPARLAADQDLAGAERDGPDEIGVRATGRQLREADGQDPAGVEDLQQDDDREERRARPER